MKYPFLKLSSAFFEVLEMTVAGGGRGEEDDGRGDRC